MTTIRRVFSLLLVAATMTSAILITAPASEARGRYVKRQRHAVRRYDKAQIKTTRKFVNQTNVANRRAVKRNTSATRRYYRHH